MRVLLFSLFILLSGCVSTQPKDLKSPCVAISSPDGMPVPCVRRSINDKWLS